MSIRKMAEVDPVTRRMVIVVTVGVVIVLLVALLLVWTIVTIPLAKDQEYSISYFTPCQRSLTDVDCSPVSLTEKHCGPGVVDRDVRCQDFCESLGTKATPFPVCSYMNACQHIRQDDFFEKQCSSDTCAPTDIMSILGCSPVRMRQFCDTGIASSGLCQTWCETYFLEAWKGHTSFPMQPVCTRLSAWVPMTFEQNVVDTYFLNL